MGDCFYVASQSSLKMNVDFGFWWNPKRKQYENKNISLFSPPQINRAPSFGTDQKIDYDVKKGVLLDTLKLLNIRYEAILSPESH